MAMRLKSFGLLSKQRTLPTTFTSYLFGQEYQEFFTLFLLSA